MYLNLFRLIMFYLTLCGIVLICYVVKDSYALAEEQFERYFIEDYGDGNSIDQTELENLMANTVNKCQSKNTQSYNSCNQNITVCMLNKCLGATDLIGLMGGDVNVKSFPSLCPALLYQLYNPACSSNKSALPEEPLPRKPSNSQIWGYGLLAATITNGCALLGIFFHPLMKTKYYSKVFMFMESLGIGTLTSSAIIVLIPETYDLEHNKELMDAYLWPSVAIVGGIYLFFLVERLLGALKISRENRDNSTKEDGHHSHGDGDIRSVAWMIIFGDGLHNFVDGLSIAAAFSSSLLLGASVSIAIFCEELPHELGDFAILLSSGMPLKKALLFNFLSACLCYVGIVVGVVIGGIASAKTWIFAVAAGMFLYIGLAAMLPQVNREADAEVKKSGKILPTFLIQNGGLITGFAAMLILALFSGHIRL